MHEYFYGAQSSTYSFIRVPTVLFTDDQYKYVSAEAKVLYGLLLARMDLSAKNGWLDDQGRVYIICTLSEIMEKLNCADNKATKLMNELEDKCGLIERKRQGLGKPNLIYVKNFLSVDNAVESRFKSRDNHDSGVAEITIPDSSKTRPSNKDQKYIDLLYTILEESKDESKKSVAVMKLLIKINETILNKYNCKIKIYFLMLFCLKMKDKKYLDEFSTRIFEFYFRNN